MVAVDAGEALLVKRLALVVALFQKGAACLTHYGIHGGAWSDESNESFADGCRTEVGGDGLLDPWILDLHSDFGTVRKPSAVNLTNRRGGSGHGSHVLEKQRRPPAELCPHDVGDALERHGGRVSLQHGKRGPHLGRQRQVEIAQELAGLHGEALELPYRCDDGGESVDVDRL